MKKRGTPIELLRIFFLLFLIIFHWFYFEDSWKWYNYIDTRILTAISKISVFGFAAITGFFSYSERSHVFKNVYRLLFIIFISLLISPLFFTSINAEWSAWNITYMVSGSHHSWYLYSIIPVFIFAKYTHKFINKINPFHLLIFSFIAFVLVFQFTSLKLNVNKYVNYIIRPNETLYLLLITLMGNGLRRILDDSKRKNNLIFSSILILMSFATIISLELGDTHYSGRFSPDVGLFALSIVSLFYCLRWKNKKLNRFVQYCYFIYEFHWLWQLVWYKISYKFNIEHPHLQLYLNILFIGFSSFITSVICTLIQDHFWNKFLLKRIQKIQIGNIHFSNLRL